MNVLLDTNLVSELRRPVPDPRVLQRLAVVPSASAFMSVITLGELEYGAKRVPDSRKRRELALWLANLRNEYASRLLAIDAETALAWGELVALCEAKGRPVSPQDGLIAATAQRHGLHLMTRNTRNFEHTGVLLINPWDD
jgi:hypothetical protein